jgi:hypothetical protein
MPKFRQAAVEHAPKECAGPASGVKNEYARRLEGTNVAATAGRASSFRRTYGAPLPNLLKEPPPVGADRGESHLSSSDLHRYSLTLGIQYTSMKCTNVVMNYDDVVLRKL